VLDAPVGALSRSSGATGTDGAVAAWLAGGAASTDITCTSGDAGRGVGASLATRSGACVKGPPTTSTQPIPAPNAAAIGHQRRLRGAKTYGDTRTGPSNEGNSCPMNACSLCAENLEILRVGKVRRLCREHALLGRAKVPELWRKPWFAIR